MDQRTNQTTTDTAALAPNEADISAHLYALFAPAFVAPYQTSSIEIAYGLAATGGKVNQARNFSPFDIKAAVEFAVKKNRLGFNVYVGPALRDGKRKGSGRSADKDVLTSAFAWAEFDRPGDDERIQAVLKEQQLTPKIIVTTGTVPNLRAHLYLGLDGVSTPADLVAINTTLMHLFGSDAVQNASRVMRLAGTINYPTPAKAADDGYVPELTTLQLLPATPAYKIAKLIGLSTPKESTATKNAFADAGDKATSRDDDELKELLETSRDAKKWHNSIRDAVASLVGRGWSDTQIKFTCDQYCKGGGQDADLAKIIITAREKWNVPDPDEQAIDSKSDISRLNKIHAVLPIGGKTRVVTFGELEEFPGRETIVMTQSFGDFASLLNKYRHQYLDEKKVMQEIPMGSYWLSSRKRRQYDGGMAFMPRESKSSVGNKLNLWRGYGVDAIKPDGKSGAAGCNLFLDFMLNVMCSGNEEHFDYLRKREAVILQQRIRSEVALGWRSDEEGVGKGYYEHTMGHLLGVHAMQVGNPKHVIGAFNPHLETLLRLTADEALFVGNPEHRNALFGLITEPKLTIEPKGCGVYRADSFLNLSVLSNSKHFVPISGTARRFFLPTVSPIHMQDHAYFKAIQDQLDNGGYQALLYHFLHEVDLTGFNVRMVPKTKGLMEQRGLSLLPLENWWVELLETGTLFGSDPHAPHRAVSNSYPRNFEVDPGNGASVQVRIVSQLGLYDQARLIDPRLKHHTSDVTFAGHLRAMGCTNNQKVLRKNGWSFPPLLACREAWEKRFGGWDWRDTDIKEWRAEDQDDPAEEESLAGDKAKLTAKRTKARTTAEAAAKAKAIADQLAERSVDGLSPEAKMDAMGDVLNAKAHADSLKREADRAAAALPWVKE